MNTQQKIIKNKLGLLNLAETLGNIRLMLRFGFQMNSRGAEYSSRPAACDAFGCGTIWRALRNDSKPWKPKSRRKA